MWRHDLKFKMGPEPVLAIASAMGTLWHRNRDLPMWINPCGLSRVNNSY